MKFFLIFLILIGFAGWAHADNSLFEYEIFPVNLEVNNIELRNVFDWTSDGKILFSAKLEDDTETLILVSADGKIIKQLDISSVDNGHWAILEDVSDNQADTTMYDSYHCTKWDALSSHDESTIDSVY